MVFRKGGGRPFTPHSHTTAALTLDVFHKGASHSPMSDRPYRTRLYHGKAPLKSRAKRTTSACRVHYDQTVTNTSEVESEANDECVLDDLAKRGESPSR